MNKLKIAVLVSGSGSNLQVLIDAMQSGELPIEMVGVICNVADAHAITRANNANIPTAVLSHVASGKRMGIKTFEKHALEQLAQWQPDLIVLAGFMRVLSAEFIDASPAPMINLHPSLLPKYKGLDTHTRAIEAGERHHGCSVHLVTAELDGGQVLTQAQLSLTDADRPESLQKRVQVLEHQLLPWTVLQFANGSFAPYLGTILDTGADNSASCDNELAKPVHLPALPWRLDITGA